MRLVLLAADGGQQCCSVVHTEERAITLFGRDMHCTYHMIHNVIALSSVVGLQTPIKQLPSEYITDTRPHVHDVGCGWWWHQGCNVAQAEELVVAVFRRYRHDDT